MNRAFFLISDLPKLYLKNNSLAKICSILHVLLGNGRFIEGKRETRDDHKMSGNFSAQIAKDAKECVQECVSEFISFITSEASERCHQEKRKTINGEDILFAMSTLGFDMYVEPLKLYLQKFREVCVCTY